MKKALPFLLCSIVLALACSGKVTEAGGLEVQISVQSLQVGTDFDTLKVDIAQEAQQGGAWPSRNYYDGGVTAATFPTTVAVVAGPSSDQNVRVTVSALLGTTLVVKSEAQTTVPTDRVLELDMFLSRSCVGVTCADADTSCVSGGCTSIVIPEGNLAPYMPGGDNGTGGSSGGGLPDSSLPSSSGVGGDGSSGGVCAADCAGCCDPIGACVTVGSMCSNGGTCTGRGASCSGSGTCDAAMQSHMAATCAASAGCYQGNCVCIQCTPGSACSGSTCLPSAADGGAGCSPSSCPNGCCDGSGCVLMGGSCPAAGGFCAGTAGAPCSPSTGTCPASLCPGGCCTNSGSCIALGGTCPNLKVCTTAGTSCTQAGGCGAPGLPCCQPGNACSPGTCTAGMCTGAASCSVPTEPMSASGTLDGSLMGMPFSSTDGFVVLTPGPSGTMNAMFYFTSYANACGYAQSSTAKSGGEYVTFGVSPTSGSSYQSLIGTFVSGGSNLGPALTVESPSGTACSTQYLVSGQCGSGQLLIDITQASATQVTMHLSGACSSPDKLTTSGTVTLPVCSTSLSVQGTSSCCP